MNKRMIKPGIEERDQTDEMQYKSIYEISAPCGYGEKVCFGDRKCITENEVCDGDSQCSDNSDESYAHANCWPGRFSLHCLYKKNSVTYNIYKRYERKCSV